MSLEGFLEPLYADRTFGRLMGLLDQQKKVMVIAGAQFRAYALGGVVARRKGPFLVVCPAPDAAERMTSDLGQLTRVYHFPNPEILPHERLSPGVRTTGARLEILRRLSLGEDVRVVASVQALLRRVAPALGDHFSPVDLRVGSGLEPYALVERLVSTGYERVPLVEAPGQVSLRGGVLDVFPSTDEHPIRVELLGDEIESIRIFEIGTQRSAARVDRVTIWGCREFPIEQGGVERALELLGKLPLPWLREELEKLGSGMYFEGIEKYLPFLYESPASLFDYLPEAATVVIDEPEAVLNQAKDFFERQERHLRRAIEQGTALVPPVSYYLSPDELPLERFRILELSAVRTAAPTIEFEAVQPEPVLGRLEKLKEQISSMLVEGLRVAICMPDEGQLGRMEELLSEAGIISAPSARFLPDAVALSVGDLASGFVSRPLGSALLTRADIFVRRHERRWERGARTQELSDLSDLKVGDFVVHKAHGIARYGGLVKRRAAGIAREYALLEYAGGDKLYVPSDQLDRLSKYIGGGPEPPTVSRLGSLEWQRAKRRAKDSAKKLAYDLLSLYAERANATGIAFSPDGPWQRELEDAFPYEETSDQLRAIDEVKRDMEQVRPMDRLVGGDVGYGKTEVAVRAAFKAVIDGKQAIVLVPTTILAQQHYATFSERFAPFPIVVEVLSRFRSPAKQRAIVRDFAEGRIDVLIGTHRLLQRDVVAHGLGLVIVDEEQRFGVAAKDHLRQLKKSVDVLTLSATPIPRTLQMSLSGVRDLSVIDTPPEGRYPILTHVGAYDRETLRDATERELSRGGQVYYVHNRVFDIYERAKEIQELVPDARVVVAHGQMGERQLERTMLDFLEKEYDVLVCTTIIESGIDIPTVNTLIVDGAERLGLAQLYQLRGRVGRANERAYAYFFYRDASVLTLEAFERLKTIADLTGLGSGMRIALRDLEIRGAGNLLGPEQHGHMAAVGFELYCELLREAVHEAEGRPVERPVEVKMDVPVDAYLPEDFVPLERERIEFYRKLLLARDERAIGEVAEELRDRYGRFDGPVVALLEVARLRLLARRAGVEDISYRRGRLSIHPLRPSVAAWTASTAKYPELKKLTDGRVSARGITQERVIPFLLSFFDDIIQKLDLRPTAGKSVRKGSVG